ncbi:putative protein family UPF0363 [Cordyceps fumosorosea ARSEF 2679]|uniref:Protein family UPF0363 n=1 Tax=Cordyceps fumosorosea (strain ARSEF 2679) TaxID=1081104 RepID=A0A168DD78_CORFA|nr:putative protein family UPF0363 [Cordyceps fumosorosea ARSEF 2679]OAA72463.1 putative protein family UPF0363 [Cordyceps fumosorosea ARSEF 2679]
MASKVDRIVAGLLETIAAGDYYKAHQDANSKAIRYIHKKDWTAAVDILYSVAQALLKAGNGGSGGDLCNQLVDVYKQAGLKPNEKNNGRLCTLLRFFDSEEPTRNEFIKKMLGWSANDPELHHEVGSLYAAEHNTDEAEKHLIRGTEKSAGVLFRMEYAWYKESGKESVERAAWYAARAVLPNLLVGNVRDANTCYRLFVDTLRADHPNLTVEDVPAPPGSGAEVLHVFSDLPLLNFLGLLLLTVQRGARKMFLKLKSNYTAQINEVEGGDWDEALERIEEKYFSAPRPAQSDPLMDMMSRVFGGGGGGGAGGQPPQQKGRPALPADAVD